MNAPILDRYRDPNAGVLTCYDRIVITGTLPGACYAAGMTSFLDAQHVRKEDVVAAVIIPDRCMSFRPWRNRAWHHKAPIASQR